MENFMTDDSFFKTQNSINIEEQSYDRETDSGHAKLSGTTVTKQQDDKRGQDDKREQDVGDTATARIVSETLEPPLVSVREQSVHPQHGHMEDNMVTTSNTGDTDNNTPKADSFELLTKKKGHDNQEITFDESEPLITQSPSEDTGPSFIAHISKSEATNNSKENDDTETTSLKANKQEHLNINDRNKDGKKVSSDSTEQYINTSNVQNTDKTNPGDDKDTANTFLDPFSEARQNRENSLDLTQEITRQKTEPYSPVFMTGEDGRKRTNLTPELSKEITVVPVDVPPNDSQDTDGELSDTVFIDEHEHPIAQTLNSDNRQDHLSREHHDHEKLERTLSEVQSTNRKIDVHKATDDTSADKDYTHLTDDIGRTTQKVHHVNIPKQEMIEEVNAEPSQNGHTEIKVEIPRSEDDSPAKVIYSSKEDNNKLPLLKTPFDNKSSSLTDSNADETKTSISPGLNVTVNDEILNETKHESGNRETEQCQKVTQLDASKNIDKDFNTKSIIRTETVQGPTPEIYTDSDSEVSKETMNNAHSKTDDFGENDKPTENQEKYIQIQYTNGHNAQLPDHERKVEPGDIPNPYFTGRLPTLESIEPYILQKDNTETQQTALSDQNNQNGDVTTTSKFEEEHIITDEDKRTARQKRIPTPSKNIREIIREMNAPSQIYSLSKEKPITPRSTSKNEHYIPTGSRLDDAATFKTEIEQSPTPSPQSLSSGKTFGLENTNLKVGDINALTSNVMNERLPRMTSETSKFDDLPHMKRISKYTEDEKLAKLHTTVPADVKHDSENVKTTTDDDKAIDNVSRHNDPLTQLYITEHLDAESSHSPAKAWETSQQVKPLNRSLSATDIKEMLDSAKKAFDSEIELPPINNKNTPYHTQLLVDQDRHNNVDHKLNVTAEESDCSTWRSSGVVSNYTDSLICSNCLQLDSEVGVAGFCALCEKFLCDECTSKHQRSRKTRKHEVLKSYCVNELKLNKYIKATGYCLACKDFLCSKCVILHTGFRANRHHRIVQSSFVSNPKNMSSVRTGSTLDSTIGGSIDLGLEESERGMELKQKRREIIKPFWKANPYRSPFKKVSKSLYPGKKEKLSISYASKPNWPNSSVPVLPYLIKPNASLRERTLQSPYLRNYKSNFFTQPKTMLEANNAKMHKLHARYSKQRDKRTARRREFGVFTARPVTRPDQFTLPDIRSVQTSLVDTENKQGPTEEKVKVKELNTNRLKTSTYVRDHCLSIPFPSNEKRAQIREMVVLFNRKLVILDSQNNNIKLYSKVFTCKAVLNFNNKLIDICESNLNPNELYVATTKHIYEIAAKKGLELQRKIVVDGLKIEGMICWKYGLAVIGLKNMLTWELKLMDYRGNSTSKLEILNPFLSDIEPSFRYHMVSTKGGGYVAVMDSKNACVICVDVTTRCVVFERKLDGEIDPSYLTADSQHNLYVSCMEKVYQLSKKGKNLGMAVTTFEPGQKFGCIVYNKTNNCMYIQTGPDVISVFSMHV